MRTIHENRVRLMASGDRGTWDLSPKDVAALRDLIAQRDDLLAACEEGLADLRRYYDNNDGPGIYAGTAAVVDHMLTAIAKARGGTP